MRYGDWLRWCDAERKTAGSGHPGGRSVAIAVIVGILSGLVSIAVRFRRARGEERAQIKWFFYATVVAVLVLVLTNVLFPVEMEQELGAIVWLTAPMSILVAMAVAIARYRLFDIDQIVARTVTHGTVVVLLAATYAGVVFLLRDLLPLEGPVAVAGSTLLVAALFNPLRRRIQGLIDRRFNRSRYDVTRTIETFSQGLSSAVELVPLRSELSRLSPKRCNKLRSRSGFAISISQLLAAATMKVRPAA